MDTNRGDPRAAISGERPAIAIVSNAQTPYRLHLHRRIAAEIPEIRLFSLYTHQTSNSSWAFAAPPEIGPVEFGAGEAVADQDRISGQLREWQRGGRIVRWLVDHNIRFVLMMGYNDAGRIRIMRWCRRRGVPCFLFGDSNVHGDRSRGAKAALKQWVLRRVLSFCDGVFVCGRLGHRYFARYGVPDDQVFLFPYEPDYELIRNMPADTVSAIAGRYQLPLDRHRLVYSGRLVEVKRVDLLIDAFVAIANDRPHWDLLVIGDGPLRESLAARVPTELAHRIVWTGFLDDQLAVTGLYRSCEVLVLPSDYEPWALVINEAVAAGLAVVSSDVVGASAELVQDHVNGRLFPPGNLSALVECLRDVTNPTVLKQMHAATEGALTDWRRRGDPVAGLKSALRFAGVI